MRLPLLISVPHGGEQVPDYARELCRLSAQEILVDGDEGSVAIYQRLRERVEQFVSNPIARAVLDMNRAEDDIRLDGVIKSHTCWQEPVWHSPPDEALIERLLSDFHRPYHQALSQAARAPRVRLGVDCHTMAAFGPPVGPDAGQARPNVCLGNADGSCPDHWMALLRDCFARHFPGEVTINVPFSGGYIIRSHQHELPWVQLELSRADYATDAQKGEWLEEALGEACARLFARD